MEKREQDLITGVRKSCLCDDAGDDVDCSLQLNLTVHHEPRTHPPTFNLLSSTVQVAGPIFTSQPSPTGKIVSSRQQQRLNGGGSIKPNEGRGGTCRMCERTLNSSHWRHLKDCGLRVCNQCFYRNKRDEEKARKEANVAGF